MREFFSVFFAYLFVGPTCICFDVVEWRNV